MSNTNNLMSDKNLNMKFLIFALKDNSFEYDYGPTLILEHKINNTDKFYTRGSKVLNITLCRFNHLLCYNALSILVHTYLLRQQQPHLFQAS